MKQAIRNRTKLVGAAMVLLLTAALLYHRSPVPKGESLPQRADVKSSAESETPAHFDLRGGAEQQHPHTASPPEETDREDDPEEAGGTGYVWGTASPLRQGGEHLSSVWNREG